MKEVVILIDNYDLHDYLYVCHIFDTIVDLCIDNEVYIKKMVMNKNGEPITIELEMPESSTQDFSKEHIIDSLMFFKEDVQSLLAKYYDTTKNRLKHSYIMMVIRILLLLCAHKADVRFDYIKYEKYRRKNLFLETSNLGSKRFF